MNEADINEQTYRPYRGKFLLTIICLLTFVFTLFYNFPVKKQILTRVDNTIKKMARCDVLYDEPIFSGLYTNMRIKTLVLPKNCSKSLKTDLQFKNLNFSLSGIDPLLLTPTIDFKTAVDDSLIQGSLSGFSNFTLRLEKSKIQTEILNSFIKLPVPLSGMVNLTALFNVENKVLDSMNLNAFSENLLMRPATIQFITLPQVNIGKFQIRASLKRKQNLEIQDLILGDAAGEIHALVSGPIKFNPKNPKRSNLDINAQIKFSNSLKKSFGGMESLLDAYLKEDGYYHFKVDGPPVLKSLKKK